VGLTGLGGVDVSGASLSRMYYDELVGPAVEARWPGLPHAAGRLGSGSDVLGLDDAVSRDHDWGLRVNLLVPPEVAGQIDAYLDSTLSDEFAGHPTRFATTWDRQVRHRVQVEDVGTFIASRSGLRAETSLSVAAVRPAPADAPALASASGRNWPPLRTVEHCR
jgi:hypothetical protein